MYSSDPAAHVVRRKSLATGAWEIIAGREGQAGFQDGPSHQALLHSPTALCELPGRGGVAVADSGNCCVRLIDPASGTVSTLAGACGKGEGHQDGPGPDARFSAGIRSLACLANCSVLVGDAGTSTLRCLGGRGGRGKLRWVERAIGSRTGISSVDGACLPVDGREWRTRAVVRAPTTSSLLLTRSLLIHPLAAYLPAAYPPAANPLAAHPPAAYLPTG